MSLANVANLKISILKTPRTTTAKELALLCLIRCFPNLADPKSLLRITSNYLLLFYMHQMPSEILFWLARYCLILTPVHLTMLGFMSLNVPICSDICCFCLNIICFLSPNIKIFLSMGNSFFMSWMWHLPPRKLEVGPCCGDCYCAFSLSSWAHSQTTFPCLLSL